MENRPAPLRSRRVCRFCLTESEPLNFIYERNHNKPFKIPLNLQIMSCVGIEVYAADGMPQMICNACHWNLDRSYRFKLQCHKADKALRDYPLSGVLPRPFAPIPNDPPDVNNKRSSEQRQQNEGAKKFRSDEEDMERQEIREREREHERNRDHDRERERNRDHERERNRERQIEKQRGNEDQHDYYEEEQDVGSEGDQDTNSTKDESKLEPGEIRVHACDQCDRTFPLRQALALHVQRAHRDRNYKCTECDRMFFSKYDLAKHMTTHSEEKPYSCPICNKQFSRANLLQRHEKVHRDELRYGCQHCNREFFTIEELEKHEDSVHKKEKPFQCNICNKRFTYKQGLERHEVLHNEDKTFVCEYCKEAFRTSTKLARHLTTHAGHRPYLCKLCPRSFLLSHHLTRHMRTHSVEKRHVCEDCGKAFKRKESLEVHQLTHTKRSGVGFVCDVCHESCRNRADYVTHIKQHIEAGEKMGPDGLQPDSKGKLELDSEEEEEEEQYSDGDDDYEPPPHIFKQLPKPNKPSESEDDAEKVAGKEEGQKEQIVYVKDKEGNMIKKTIKTLVPSQQKELQEVKSRQSSSNNQSTVKSSQSKQDKDAKSSSVDETEAQVQKIVASVLRESKIAYKPQNVREQNKEHANQTRGQTPGQSNTQSQISLKDDKLDVSAAGSATPKAVNTVKVIKRIFVRKPSGSGQSSVGAAAIKDGELDGTSQTLSSGHKITKKVIVCRIIRQGDTTKEIIMNPDGSIIDPAELAKLPTGNVVRRVVVKKPLDNQQSLVQTALQTATDAPHSSNSSLKSNNVVISESPKFELKTSQSTSSKSSILESTMVDVEKPATTVGDQETKEKLEQLEKRVEQQRLKIQELEARKQQEYETMEEMSPERHDESDEEQQLPLKRVFVKKKQSMYDEEQEYNDGEDTAFVTSTPLKLSSITKRNESTENEVKVEKENVEDKKVEENPSSEVFVTMEPVVPTSTVATTEATVPTSSTQREGKPTVTSTKVYGNKRIIVVKPADLSVIEETNKDVSDNLDSTEPTVKHQNSLMTDIEQISVDQTSEISPPIEPKIEPCEKENEPLKTELSESKSEVDDIEMKVDEAVAEEKTKVEESDVKMECENEEEPKERNEEMEENTNLTLNEPDLSESADIFESSDNVLDVQKSQLTDSVIALEHESHVISLNDSNDSQDSLEDKLQQMEG